MAIFLDYIPKISHIKRIFIARFEFAVGTYF